METQAYDLVCKENRDFLYEREGMPGINPNFVYMNQEVHTLKMASETRIVPDTDKRAAPKKPRKRNSDKDRLRTEAEQTAYKKLKEIIPSLKDQRRTTKLQTVREAVVYILKLQETLTGIPRIGAKDGKH